MITLGIDYGASYIGVALVENTGTGNRPLFAGTIAINARDLKDMVETRAGIRRLRRTRKTKIRRLMRLRESLLACGIGTDQVTLIVRFCRKRGYKSLFDEGESETREKESDLAYRFSRETFFESLERELGLILPDNHLKPQALSVCERVLNRKGDPFQEIRLIRIDNRGASRCAWEGCSRVTPRRENALTDPIAQQVYTTCQEKIREGGEQAREKVDDTVSQLATLGKRIRNASGEGANKEKKVLRKKARMLLREIKELYYQPARETLDNEKAWKYIETGVLNIMEKSQGRNRYCREHSAAYVKTVLANEAIPFKQTISESDIISRREQITYQKLWRYIEARVLPLAPCGIDRIVVERTAIDLLAGSRKKILDASDQTKEEMYQHGPMHRFESVSEMLRKEFNGLCAYCGKQSDSLMETEHILPRAEFFFDSYLNIVPACPRCNQSKGARTPSAASLKINGEAYEAYTSYLQSNFRTRPLHLFHTIKKGVLNLMRDPERQWEAERYLSLIASQFAQVVQSQRGPRPFARYLFSRLSLRQVRKPEIVFKSGRHTALYRNIAYPDFSKYAEREEGGVVNHAVDAILLASDLPDPKPLEALGFSPADMRRFCRAVRQKAPVAGDSGVPEPPARDFFVEGFESVKSGFVEVRLDAMCWNKRDSMTHKQDPYGLSEKVNLPTKRVSAFGLCSELEKMKDEKGVKKKVDLIHHPALRRTLGDAINPENPGKSAAEALRAWLSESVRKSIQTSAFSNNPGDQQRKKELEQFSSSDESLIPAVIGVKMFDMGVRGKIDLQRIDPQTGKTGHRYMTQPANRAVILAYPKKKTGMTDMSKPCIARVRQNYSLLPEGKGIFKELPERLKEGIILGKENTILDGWNSEVEHYLSVCGFSSYGMLTAGCVVCYGDGKKWFLKNFDESKEFRKARLRNVVGILRSPFSGRMTPLKPLT